MAKLKRKGKYEYKLEWHQNHSALVVPKVAERVLVNGLNIEECIHSHTDISDFLIMAKVPRKAQLFCGSEQVPNIIRYVITNNGQPLTKLMPAAGELGAFKRANCLTTDFYNSIKDQIGDEWDARIHTKNKSVYEERRTNINSGVLVTICNDIQMLNTLDINYDYYINEVKKITDIFK